MSDTKKDNSSGLWENIKVLAQALLWPSAVLIVWVARAIPAG